MLCHKTFQTFVFVCDTEEVYRAPYVRFSLEEKKKIAALSKKGWRFKTIKNSHKRLSSPRQLQRILAEVRKCEENEANK